MPACQTAAQMQPCAHARSRGLCGKSKPSCNPLAPPIAPPCTSLQPVLARGGQQPCQSNRSRHVVMHEGGVASLLPQWHARIRHAPCNPADRRFTFRCPQRHNLHALAVYASGLYFCCIAIHAGAQRQGRLPQCAFCPAANPHQNQPQRPQCANDLGRCSNGNRSCGNQAAIKWLAPGAARCPPPRHWGPAPRSDDRPKARRAAPLQSARPARACARGARPHRPRPR